MTDMLYYRTISLRFGPMSHKLRFNQTLNENGAGHSLVAQAERIEELTPDAY